MNKYDVLTHATKTIHGLIQQRISYADLCHMITPRHRKIGIYWLKKIGSEVYNIAQPLLRTLDTSHFPFVDFVGILGIVMPDSAIIDDPPLRQPAYQGTFHLPSNYSLRKLNRKGGPL